MDWKVLWDVWSFGYCFIIYTHLNPDLFAVSHCWLFINVLQQTFTRIYIYIQVTLHKWTLILINKFNRFFINCFRFLLLKTFETHVSFFFYFTILYYCMLVCQIQIKISALSFVVLMWVKMKTLGYEYFCKALPLLHDKEGAVQEKKQTGQKKKPIKAVCATFIWLWRIPHIVLL